MGYMIEITEDKVDKVSDNIEKALKYMGKAMQCVEQWMEESEGMGERSSFGQRGSGGSMGSRGGGSMGSRIYEDDDDDEMGMAERRRRRR